MTAPTYILGANGGTNKAHVSKNGELITANISPNTVKHWDMTVTGTAYNFAPPIVGKKMRLMNILMYANKSVGASDASISIFTSLEEDSTVAVETILNLELPKYAIRDLINLNIALQEGLYLNATTDDATIFMTMMGYYEDV